jgi:hypothetical protein
MWPRWKWRDDPADDLVLKLGAFLWIAAMIYLAVYGEMLPAFWRGLTGS